MQSINTIEGLLFRSYLCSYNLSLLHKCIKAKTDDYDTEAFCRSAHCKTNYLFFQAKKKAAQAAEGWLEYCSKNGIRIIPWFDEAYPKVLHMLKDFPPLLFVKGQLPKLNTATVVGTRTPSPIALKKIEAIVSTLAANDCGVVSGLALGIDTVALEAALKNNVYTAAILPTSLQYIYPLENVRLTCNIIESGGALVSEQASHYGAVANSFVLRNRILAVLSQYIIPVEMGKESGTQYTIEYAIRYCKNLLLCKPSSEEIDKYLGYYQGIIMAIKKYSSKNNVRVLQSLDELNGIILQQEIEHQFNLFS